LMFHLTAAAIAPYILKEMQFYQPQHWPRNELLLKNTLIF
jgi:hypothetical protein